MNKIKLMFAIITLIVSFISNTALAVTISCKVLKGNWQGQVRDRTGWTPIKVYINEVNQSNKDQWGQYYKIIGMMKWDDNTVPFDQVTNCYDPNGHDPARVTLQAVKSDNIFLTLSSVVHDPNVLYINPEISIINRLPILDGKLTRF